MKKAIFIFINNYGYQHPPVVTKKCIPEANMIRDIIPTIIIIEIIAPTITVIIFLV